MSVDKATFKIVSRITKPHWRLLKRAVWQDVRSPTRVLSLLDLLQRILMHKAEKPAATHLVTITVEPFPITGATFDGVVVDDPVEMS